MTQGRTNRANAIRSGPGGGIDDATEPGRPRLVVTVRFDVIERAVCLPSIEPGVRGRLSGASGSSIEGTGSAAAAAAVAAAASSRSCFAIAMF